MRVNGYHKYELLACVSIIQHEGVSTSCWYVSASYSARAACVRTSTADTSCLRVLASYSEGCIRADEYQYERKYEGRYELLACIGIIRREGASTIAGTISKLFFFDAEDQRVVERCLAVIVLGAQFPSYRIWVLVYRIQYSVGALKRDGGWV